MRNLSNSFSPTLHTHKHKMIPPRIHISALVRNTLLDYMLLRLLIICDAQVCRTISKVIERCRSVGFDPSHGKRYTFVNVISSILDKLFGQSLEDTRLTTPTSDDPQLDKLCPISLGPVIDDRRRYFAVVSFGPQRQREYEKPWLVELKREEGQNAEFLRIDISKHEQERVERFYICPWHCGALPFSINSGIRHWTFLCLLSFFLVRHIRIKQRSPRKFMVAL